MNGHSRWQIGQHGGFPHSVLSTFPIQICFKLHKYTLHFLRVSFSFRQGKMVNFSAWSDINVIISMHVCIYTEYMQCYREQTILLTYVLRANFYIMIAQQWNSYFHLVFIIRFLLHYMPNSSTPSKSASLGSINKNKTRHVNLE